MHTHPHTNTLLWRRDVLYSQLEQERILDNSTLGRFQWIAQEPFHVHSNITTPITQDHSLRAVANFRKSWERREGRDLHHNSTHHRRRATALDWKREHTERDGRFKMSCDRLPSGQHALRKSGRIHYTLKIIYWISSEIFHSVVFLPISSQRERKPLPGPTQSSKARMVPAL